MAGLMLILFISHVTIAQNEDIVDLAVGNENLSPLAAEIKAACQVATLQSTGPFTVFASTSVGNALQSGTFRN